MQEKKLDSEVDEETLRACSQTDRHPCLNHEGSESEKLIHMERSSMKG